MQSSRKVNMEGLIIKILGKLYLGQSQVFTKHESSGILQTLKEVDYEQRY